MGFPGKVSLKGRGINSRHVRDCGIRCIDNSNGKIYSSEMEEITVPSVP